jgi:hypothetical protein
LPEAGSAIQTDAAPHAPPHDADFCPVCRVVSQVRLGLRGPAVALAAGSSALPLRLPERVLACSAPQIQSSRPRAPPSTLLLPNA